MAITFLLVSLVSFTLMHSVKGGPFSRSANSTPAILANMEAASSPGLAVWANTCLWAR
ncbi:MAG: hypothetical protein R3F17_17040 [Planctomycetota bacterium]